VEGPESDERTRARRGIYQTLSSAFYPPRSDSRAVWERLQLIAGSTAQAEPEGDRLDLEYNRLFVGPANVPCPPYESVHRTDRPEMESGLVLGPSVTDVKRMYAQAGLSVSEHFKDLPDHVAVELEFMSYLCGKELESRGGDDFERWRKLQAEFAASHLKPWIERFSEGVLASSRSSFYSLAADVLGAFVADELEYLGIEQG
jgi:TorA maturation chaperone TorD